MCEIEMKSKVCVCVYLCGDVAQRGREKERKGVYHWLGSKEVLFVYCTSTEIYLIEFVSILRRNFTFKLFVIIPLELLLLLMFNISQQFVNKRNSWFVLWIVKKKLALIWFWCKRNIVAPSWNGNILFIRIVVNIWWIKGWLAVMLCAPDQRYIFWKYLSLCLVAIIDDD